jgi:hypothetical protein
MSGKSQGGELCSSGWNGRTGLTGNNGTRQLAGVRLVAGIYVEIKDIFPDFARSGVFLFPH